MTTTKVIDGKTYEAVRGHSGSCKGCVANDEAKPWRTTSLCRKIGACGDDIYKEVAQPSAVLSRRPELDTVNPPGQWVNPEFLAQRQEQHSNYEASRNALVVPAAKAAPAVLPEDYDKTASAVHTLETMGYTYRGGERWVPPLDLTRGYGAARITDPATSQAAAVKVKAGPLRSRIENLLRGNGNFTGTEIARMLDARLNSVTPRFAELAKAGKIKDSGRVRDGQIVWQAV